MPTVSVSVDLDDVLAECSARELRSLIRTARQMLKDRGGDDVGEDDVDEKTVSLALQARAPADIHVDVGMRQLSDVLAASRLTRHSMFVARAVGLRV